MGLGRQLFVLLQYLLPQHLVTALVHWLARIEQPAVRDALIRGFSRLYAIDLGEAAVPAAGHYRSFNEFFTRALRPGARPLAGGALALTSPCDGTVSERGTIDGDRLLQARLAAKSRWYTLEELLGSRERALPFVGGAPFRIELPGLDAEERAKVTIRGSSRRNVDVRRSTR
jgi:phosphatidylserine decarboxylase